jgi:hypothetical protein
LCRYVALLEQSEKHVARTVLSRKAKAEEDAAGLCKLKCSRPITRKRLVTTLGSYIK